MMRVVGAGLGRTGTVSLKLALERLLSEPCYHMMEVFQRPEHPRLWQAAFEGATPALDRLLDGFGASVDFPSSSFWREQAARWPDAMILLSERASADAWWTSADRTIFDALRRPSPPEMAEWRAMADAMLAHFGMSGPDDEAGAKAAYERHNAAVRAEAPAARLVCWQPGDGWEPICMALGVSVPDEPFPHENSTDEFRARSRLND